jgi:hypothetical protein
MEEEKEIKSVVTSYRLKEDTKDKLKKQLTDLNMTQEEYFNKVVAIMELENIKKNNIFSVDATELQDITQRIFNLFINLCDQGNSFLTNKDVELQELKTKYKDMLSEKEGILQQQKQELQQVYAENNVLQNENEEHKVDLMKVKSDFIKQLEQLESTINDKTNLIDEYKGKNDMLLGQLRQFEQYPAEIEKYKNLYEDCKITKFKFENDLILKNEENKKLILEVDSLKEKHVEEFTNLKEKHTEELIKAKDQAEFDKDKALLAKEKDYQASLSKITDTFNAKIKELLEENQEYNKKLTKLLEESQDKNTKINKQESLIEALVKENKNPDLLKKLGLEK